MTTDKKRKAAVRARMSRTGERYAAARRALLGSAPDAGHAAAPQPSAPGLIAGYPRVGGPIAELSAMANGLAARGALAPHTGRPYSEALLFGLGGGVGGGYFMFQYSGTPTVAVIGTRHLWQDSVAFLSEVLRGIGAQPEVGEWGGRKAADAALAAAMAAGRPALAWADEFNLTYLGMPKELEKYFLRVVGVCGIDPESGDILVDDRAGAPLRVPAEAFATARGVVSSGRRRLLYLDPPPLAASHDLGTAVLGAIRTGHEGRTQPRIRNFGLPGLAKWADLVADPTDPKGWPTTLPDGEDLVRVLVWAFASIELNGTGRGGYRPLMATFLEEAADITGRDGLRAAADRYRALGQAWSELAEALLPASAAPLGRLRELMLERWNAFEDPAGPDLPRFLALTAEADALQREAGASGVLGDAGRLALFTELRDRIRAIHAEEVAATDVLAAEAGPG